MKINNLLSLLEQMESLLSEFSFEELSSAEATHLKKSFQTFKSDLQIKIDAPNPIPEPSKEEHLIKKNTKKQSDESNIIANVSHEIRTPLNGIIGFTDLLKESKLNSNQLINVNAIQTASNSLLELVNELLEYSKLASGKEVFQKIEFNLFGLVRDVMFLCNTLVVNKKVELISHISDNVPEFLIGDPSKLTQVLLNIMGNAIKFVEKGEVSLNITLSDSKKEAVQLIFEITDNGIGISKAKLNQIFKPYTQADSDTSSEYGGTGLGLSIVKQIVENLNGSIHVDSNLGEGTTFKFIIPFTPGNDKLIPIQPIATKKSTKNLKSIVGLNILVFEDNDLNKRLIEQRLKLWKCNMHITENAQEGIHVLENQTIDVILMDLRMPIMNGFEITKLIRNNNSQRIRQIPIIALTADYTVRDQEKCTAYGINDYLLKPFSPEELLSKIVLHKNQFIDIEMVKKPLKKQKQEKFNSTKLVDLTKLYEDSDEDMVVLIDLVGLFKKNASEFILNAEQQITDKDKEGLSFSAHKIKAGVLMVKANSLANIVLRIQNECKNSPDFKHLEYLHSRFVSDYKEVNKALDEVISNLKNS
ncbi:ATP-binding protein [Aurantibacter sp.]|uniref:ATP-binding protein n=1 Tax=Aurantibacter sp. TaxID=2807103 RepID=UPI003264FF35